MTTDYQLSLELQLAADVDNLPERALWCRWFQVALQQDLQLTLRIVDLEEGRQLNHDFRGKDYATNVLTFVYDDLPLLDDGPSCLAGDVVICAPVIEREAQQQHKSLLAHYAHMALHAALHLQGYDHQTDEQAEQMEALESRLMLELNFSDPYQLSTNTHG